MNTADPHDEIGDLLRSRKPTPQPSPDLEARILRALSRPAPRPKRAFSLAWLFLPPALVALLLVFQWQRPLMPSPGAVASVEVTTPSPVDQRVEAPFELPGIADLLDGNPVQAEARALQRDAGRAGRFLISCLPSISERPN